MIRVGVGYDIHRLKTGRRLLLGGVHIPSPFGLEGHSDADVVIHALMDALLGAAALGDIGLHFPPDDPTLKDESSVAMLRQVMRLLDASGYSVGNVDVAVVVEQPKIAPYIDSMRAGLADVLRVGLRDIGIQATTNEGLGPEGRGEGISAHAVATLVPIT